MLKDHPLVSVCIPAHNVTEYLAQTVRSVLEQTYTKFELIIANGASHSGPRQLIQNIIQTTPDPRIRTILNPANFSMVENWNSAIATTRGEFLKLLCADDVLVADCLHRQVQALEAHPTAVLASGSRVIIDHNGKRLFTRNGVGATGIYSGKEMILRCILSGTNIIGDPVNVLWRRGVIDEVGTFDPEVLYCTDVEYWLRMLQKGDLFFDQKPTGLYRIHSFASANSLARVTVEDFLRTTNKLVQKGAIKLSPRQIRLIRLRSWYKNKIRRILYRFLG